MTNILFAVLLSYNLNVGCPFDNFGKTQNGNVTFRKDGGKKVSKLYRVI